MSRSTHHRIEYGDYQTPLELAEKICQKLKALGVKPDAIIEPTCGLGAFLDASARFFPSVKRIIGVEINSAYLDLLRNRQDLLENGRVEIKQGDFFNFDWENLLNDLPGALLVLGNFPWVTNAQLSVIGGANLPEKTNFQHQRGLNAITGKSNFDISEWMLIQVARWLQNRHGYLAMLCKTAVARKLLNHLYSQQLQLADAAIFAIDAEKYFGTAVEACLLFCKFDGVSRHYDYEVFESLESKAGVRAGYRDGVMVRDLAAFDALHHLHGESAIMWRSGVKHDCAEVMEFRKTEKGLVNGLGEAVDIEPDYLFPLLKGSVLANGQVESTTRYVLMTQQFVGESTDDIQKLAPKTWAYLEAHAKHLDSRKSRVHRNQPRFAIFGVGAYTFAPWKIAICGLYKTLQFRLVGEIEGKPAIFDDTVYFLSFADEQQARKIYQLLLSPPATRFFSSMIFWDEKRPIKAGILNRFDWRRLQTLTLRTAPSS
ncbi:MAG: class I SAM-dependent methyltransferase [candidate division KSB1 bacterium]|nr:class I SAM-dependent methyltransferase [candidate division KSB1 bacterium]MDZ7368543.1 class I SAM-dependent methyltransferase [candidate division KSB1 bacterium]MDZ7406229.1 class I SAM-dependent methyltransferase [candidate division KSB1 bacterium]